MESNNCAIAIDLGGTKLASAVVDDSGKIRYRRKTTTVSGELCTSIDCIAEAIRQAEESGGCTGKAGLIVPGIYFADTGFVWAPNLWGDRQIPLRAELEKRLSLPVVIDSDRAGCVLGEQWMGIARGMSDCVYLSVGTGIGAGIISGGRLVRGASDIAGAVGWFALNRMPKESYRKVGCWEAESAGPALARQAGTVTAEEAVAAARSGDVLAQDAIREAAYYLGLGIANMVSLLNPQMVVLGGGLMQAADLFVDIVRQTVEEWAQPIAARQVRIEKTALGEDAGLLGAARLALGV
jgi:glucokinase